MMAGLIVFVVMLSVVAALYWYLAISYKTTVSSTVLANEYVSIKTGTMNVVNVVLIPSSTGTPTYIQSAGGDSVSFTGLTGDTYTAIVMSKDFTKIHGITTFTLTPPPPPPPQIPVRIPSMEIPSVPSVSSVAVRAPGPSY